MNRHRHSSLNSHHSLDMTAIVIVIVSRHRRNNNILYLLSSRPFFPLSLLAGRFAPHFSLFFLFRPPAPFQSLQRLLVDAGGGLLYSLLNREIRRFTKASLSKWPKFQLLLLIPLVSSLSLSKSRQILRAKSKQPRCSTWKWKKMNQWQRPTTHNSMNHYSHIISYHC